MDNPPKCQLTFWGTRGSIPTPGRATEKYGGNTSCVSIRLGDLLVVIDAGTGLADVDTTVVRIRVAAQAIGEPIARHGPFVMNTREELVQAFEDYQAGKLGEISR